MGQYWKVVNLSKREFVSPHKLGCGLKLWEQLANHPGTGTALVILCAAMPMRRDGGDLDLDENWHGPERSAAMKSGAIDGCTPGPMPEEYSVIAARTIGRWAGDRIAFIGDYAEDDDIKDSPLPASLIYSLCNPESDIRESVDWMRKNQREDEALELEKQLRIGIFEDVSDDVCAVIEHELDGKFVGDGWRNWVENGAEVAA